MKNNIKNKLIEAANKQQINDLSDEIIRKVDTTKVLNSTPSRKKSFNFAPFIFAGATACTLAVVIGVSIGLNVNRGTNTNNPTNSAFDFTNTSSEEVQRLLNKISTQESYNIINIANSLDVVLDDVKNNNASIEEGIMNPEIEIALAKDFNPYIYNIEAMYDLYDPIVSTVSNNTNSLYSYEKDLKIVSPYYEYHLYYDEVITEQKNANEDNYKEKSDIDGIIICGFNAYDFETHKTIKNDTVEYKSTIYVSTTKYVEIDSKFTTDRNIYTYTYYNDNETKEVNIEQMEIFYLLIIGKEYSKNISEKNYDEI